MPVRAELSPEQIEKLPPSASHPVQFEKEIRPLLESRCLQCHARGKAKGGFSLENREKLLQGGDSGPALVPGQSARSYLIELVSGLNPDIVMPSKGKRLTGEQVGLLRAWIDQGALWGEQTTFKRPSPKNLVFDADVIAWLAGSSASANPIDREVREYFDRTNFTPPPVVSDRVFARRVYLDAIGLLPTPQQMEHFVNDTRPNKRAKLVEALLQEGPAYAEHWLSFWNDLLRNDYTGTGYIDEGRKQISGWLYEALLRNEPFDRFVQQLIMPNEASEGFLKGIVWRGVVNASQSIPMQAAQSVSQVFLGVNLKCASCHDSFVSDWALSDAYGMAGIFAENELEMVQCDKPLGKLAPIRFLYPELGGFTPGADRPARLQRLAEILVSEKNGRLAMTLVNRLWERTMGRGLIEPVDDLEQPAWDPRLLQILAMDLVRHRYDLKRALTVIFTSQAYQLPSVESARRPYQFEGPLTRRLTAEQFQDAVNGLTGGGGNLPGSYETMSPDLDLLEQLRHSDNEPRWIWADDPGAEQVFFRKEFTLLQKPKQAAAVVTASQSFTFYVNGKVASASGEYVKLKLVDLLPLLRPGHNVFAVSARKGKRPASPNAPSGILESNNTSETEKGVPPAGMICYARILMEGPEEGGASLDIVSDQAWSFLTREVEDWFTNSLVTDEERAAREYAIYTHPAWNLENKFNRAITAISRQSRFRASLMKNDSLQAALGRPNREQIVTTRNGQASTLQMLELTNGKLLADRLAAGGSYWTQHSENSGQLITRIFQAALARDPNPEERSLGVELLGEKPASEAVADLLWSVVMLPEFQFIP